MKFLNLTKKLLFISYLIINIFLNNILFIIKHFNNIKYEFKIKVAICLIAKNENRYIKEFIEYYKKLGIKKIFLYDNNDINGENFMEILKNYINNSYIQLINYRGLYKPQKKAYNDCYNNNKNEFDWIAFFDTDEFLYIINYSNVQEFLSLPRFDNCTNILINWRYYGDNNNIYYKKKLMKERFPKPYFFKNKDKKDIYLYSAAKTIVRGGLNITWEHFPHYLKNQIFCRPDGSKIKTYFSEPQFSVAYIKHYATKSTQEFIERILRGAVLSKNNSTDYIKYRINQYYFLINKKTKKKIKLFEKMLKIKID